MTEKIVKSFSIPPSLFPCHNFLQTFPMKTWKTSKDIVHVGHEAYQHNAALFYHMLKVSSGSPKFFLTLWWPFYYLFEWNKFCVSVYSIDSNLNPLSISFI